MTGPRRYKRDRLGRFAKTSLAGQKAAPSARRPRPPLKKGSGGLRVASGTLGRPPRVGPRADVSVNVGLRSVQVSAEKRLPVARGRVQLTATGGLKAELVAR